MSKWPQGNKFPSGNKWPASGQKWPRGNKWPEAADEYSPLDEGNALFRLDMQNAAAYTESGGNVTAFVNTVTSTSYSTLSGNTAFDATGLNSRPCMVFAGTSWIAGAEAAIQTHFGANDPAFHVFAVCSVDAVDPASSSGMWVVCNSGISARCALFGQSNTGAGFYRYLRVDDAAVSTDWDSEPGALGIQIVEWRSSNGEQVFCRKNGGVESNENLTTAGVITLNRVAVGARADNVPDSFFVGRIGEIIVYSADKTAGDAALRVRQHLAAKWGVTLP